jgi:hypothetical protein
LGDRILYFCFGNEKAAQFHFWEYINGTRHLYWIFTGPSFAMWDLLLGDIENM